LSPRKNRDGRRRPRLADVRSPHVLEISDGKIVRFDQYVDSAAINPIIGA
jgi:ketosteroid isomerase-like protein